MLNSSPPSSKTTHTRQRSCSGCQGEEKGRLKNLSSLRVEFLEFACTTSKDKHLYPMLVFAAHTGARRSELMRMEIDDVDFQADSAFIRKRKKNLASGACRAHWRSLSIAVLVSCQWPHATAARAPPPRPATTRP